MFRKACLLLLVFILIPCISNAEIKTYIHTVKQSFGGSQSPDDARVGAIAKAKREVLEKAGTYLESLTIVRESVVEKDEILALAAGVLKAEIVSQKNFAAENQRLKNLPAKEQKQEILKNQFREATQGLTASELMNKALDFWKDGKYTDPDKALEYLNKAISIDSNYADAYYNRGLTWIIRDNYDQAISDFNKAIELNPGYADAYSSRGITWHIKGNYDQAVSDYNDYLKINGNKDGKADRVRQEIRNLGYTPKY